MRKGTARAFFIRILIFIQVGIIVWDLVGFHGDGGGSCCPEVVAREQALRQSSAVLVGGVCKVCSEQCVSRLRPPRGNQEFFHGFWVAEEVINLVLD